MTIEAMKQALAVLEEIADEVFSPYDNKLGDAILALRAAIEQPRQWVGLTDEERRNIREWQKIQDELGPVWAPMMLYLYLAIEEKLKKKNHG
jgi:hypothetical protein